MRYLAFMLCIGLLVVGIPASSLAADESPVGAKIDLACANDQEFTSAIPGVQGRCRCSTPLTTSYVRLVCSGMAYYVDPEAKKVVGWFRIEGAAVRK